MAFTKMSQKRGNKASLMQCQETGEEEGSNYQNVAEVGSRTWILRAYERQYNKESQRGLWSLKESY